MKQAKKQNRTDKKKKYGSRENYLRDRKEKARREEAKRLNRELGGYDEEEKAISRKS